MQTGEDKSGEIDKEVTGEEQDDREADAQGAGKRGRPKGIGRSRLEILKEGFTSPESKRRQTSSPKTDWSWKDDRTEGTLPKQRDATNSSSRPSFYLLGKAPTSLNMSKLPKSGPVLGRLVLLLESHSLAEASMMVGEEVKAVWNYHFGPRFILGKEFGKECESNTDDKLKIIKRDIHIADKISKLYKQWRNLEGDSRRPDRALRTSFLDKQQKFILDLDLPFDIRKVDADTIIQDSDTIYWREEVEYLGNQMTREQAGSVGSHDMRQKKRDDRVLKGEINKENTDKEKAKNDNELEKNKAEYEKEDTNKVLDENDNDKNFSLERTRIRKIDVMGKISLTCDAKNISIRDRTVIAASVVNALGIDINQTNINQSTAWRKGNEARLEKSKDIMETYVFPDKVIVYWDGKTFKLEGRIMSKRVCIYISGVDVENIRKLLGIPEVESGKGVDEFEMVKEYLVKWNIMEQIIGMVFDTTASNSGADSGACRYLEIWIDTPILWLACRRHVAELHIGTAMKHIMGTTTEPGVKLFRRLRDQWRDIQIDYSEFVLSDFSEAPHGLDEVAREMLTWAREQLLQKTFPRDDYKEFMELVVISLGGEVEGFTLKLPGPDHHARWMSKCIYSLKLKLLGNVFEMTDEEKHQVNQVVDFILLFYAKYWFTAPLAGSAARQDLDFMSGVLKYKEINPSLCFAVLCSAYRHLWYLTPQLITLAMTDKELEDSSRMEIAQVLHSQERKVMKTGKPTFPLLPHGATNTRENISMLIGPGSWLVFDLLNLPGPQDWLLTPTSEWHLSPDYLKLDTFSSNLVIVNDLAERGIHLATDFINRVESDEQREALFQVVEDFRGRVKDTTKASLKLC